MSSASFDVSSRKRLRSIIQQGDSNSTRVWQRENVRAFERVLERVYIPNRFTHPVRCSSTALDINGEYRRFTFDCLIVTADVERAIEKALGNDKELLDRFWEWFILPEIEPGVDPPLLTGQQSKIHGQIVQKVGREFHRRGLYPIHRYFRLPERAQRIVEAA